MALFRLLHVMESAEKSLREIRESSVLLTSFARFTLDSTQTMLIESLWEEAEHVEEEVDRIEEMNRLHRR